MIKGLDALTDAERHLLADARRLYSLDDGHPVLAVKGAAAPSHLEPAAIVIVTAGGHKLRHPRDAATTARLRSVFGAYQRDRRTGAITGPAPLPADLTLPRVRRRAQE